MALDFASMLLTLLAPVVAGLIAIAVRKLAKRFDLEIGEKQRELMNDTVLRLVMAAEERGRRALKLGDYEFRGEAKARWVYDQFTRQFPDALPGDVERMIDEALGTVVGMGASVGVGLVGASLEPTPIMSDLLEGGPVDVTEAQ